MVDGAVESEEFYGDNFAIAIIFYFQQEQQNKK